MVEFAYSGVGINPHYGTPRSVWGRTANGGGRVPGGSSSGAAVSVADGMCVAALGTDTGGSVRIPAAFNGLVGFKPTAVRVPVLGTIPLSVTHDSIGPLAQSVACCAALDAVLSGEQNLPSPLVDLRGVRLLKPQALVWRELDPEVEAATLAAVETLRKAGAEVIEAPLPPLDELLTRPGSMLAAEALDWHTANINVDGVGYDPRVWKRMQLGRDVTRGQYSSGLAFRRFWVDRMNLALADFDAVICPTVACVPPEITPLVADDELFFKTNARILRNTAWVNFLDGCGITLPCHNAGEAPVGLQLVARHSADRRLLALGAACETALSRKSI
jgi:aspartyl-tRNA(Asn)/glutamyl-tRNA(Gln) amidotransferase subunit A